MTTLSSTDTYTGPDWLLILLTRVNKDVAELISLMLWRTWSMRNDVMHGEKLKPVAASVSFLLNYVESCNSVVLIWGRRTREGTKHDYGWVNVNVDGASDQLTGHAGIGIIIRESSGKPELCAWKAIFDGLYAKEIEALACLEGVRLAVELTHGKAIIESDCSTVIAASSKPGRDRSQLAFIVNELKHVSRLLPEVGLKAVKREQSVIARELALLAKRTTHSAVWRMRRLPNVLSH
uniref:RNase H type-1 domain-containing protein n=1 Tax=Setaria italica TaxID=4555 RepID=K3Y1U9_SETIT